MKKKRKSTKVVIISLIVILAIALITTGVFVYRKTHQPKNTIANQIPSSKDSGSNTAQSDVNTQQQNTSAPAASATTPATPAPVPIKPTFTKSSGNNGSIPPNVLVNFICNAEPGTTCQIILTSGSKQIALPEQEVKDNGRGQWFTSWDWTSVTGKWNVIARAKNKQGGINDSINQALEVK